MDNTWGFGNNPSPRRSLLLGFTALELNNKEVAKKELDQVIQSGCYKNLEETIKAKVENIDNE